MTSDMTPGQVDLFWRIAAVYVGVALLHAALIAAVVWGVLRRILRMHREGLVVLEVVKEWASVARVQHREAALAAREVVPAVEQVPEKTAERVVERLSGESGVHPGGR